MGFQDSLACVRGPYSISTCLHGIVTLPTALTYAEVTVEGYGTALTDGWSDTAPPPCTEPESVRLWGESQGEVRLCSRRRYSYFIQEVSINLINGLITGSKHS